MRGRKSAVNYSALLHMILRGIKWDLVCLITCWILKKGIYWKKFLWCWCIRLLNFLQTNLQLRKMVVVSLHFDTSRVSCSLGCILSWSENVWKHKVCRRSKDENGYLVSVIKLNGTSVEFYICLWINCRFSVWMRVGICREICFCPYSSAQHIKTHPLFD